MSDVGTERLVRMEQLAARWAAADGMGPVPGTHAFERAEEREDAPHAELALAVAEGAVENREKACAAPGPCATVGSSGRASPETQPDEPTVAHGRPALRVTLDELQSAGRPIPVLLPDERTRLEARAEADPAGFDQALADVKARAQIEADRLRLLFDLERLAAHLPAGLRDELTAAAAALDAGPAAAETVRTLRGRLLDGLVEHAGR